MYTVCIYIYIYTIMYIYIYIYIYIHYNVYNIYIYIYTLQCIYIYIYTYTTMYIYIYTHTYIHTYIHYDLLKWNWQVTMVCVAVCPTADRLLPWMYNTTYTSCIVGPYVLQTGQCSPAGVWHHFLYCRPLYTTDGPMQPCWWMTSLPVL